MHTCTCSGKTVQMVGFRYEGNINEHNLGIFVEHNRMIFGAVQHSIIGYI